MVESPLESGLLDAMPDGLYVVSTKRAITYWNSGAAQISGFTAEDAVGRWCGDGLLNHVDEFGEPMCGARCPLVATMRDGERRTVHAFLHHKDGHVVPVRVSAAPVRDTAGAIVGAVETFSDDTAFVQLRDDLTAAEERSLTDALTGIGNRRAFDQDMDRRLALWERDGQLFALITADLDHFKDVNDTHGHEVGDRVLQVVARSITGALRRTDTVFRSGGDEFAVLAGPVTHEDLAALAARIAMVVPASRYGGELALRIQATLGCALVEPGDDAARLRQRADRMLYAGKSARPERTPSPGSQPREATPGSPPPWTPPPWRDHAELP